MVVVSRPRAPVLLHRLSVRCGVWTKLAACALLINLTLILAITLPMRLDRQPPALGTNLARVYGENARGLAAYLVVIALLLGGYLAAIKVTPRAGLRAALVLTTVGGLLSASLIPAHPTYSADVFHYIATARVGFVHGGNPLVDAPSTIPGDPLLALSGWPDLASPYGPAWTWLSALPLALPRASGDATWAVVWFKALAVALTVATTAGVAVTAARIRPGSGPLAAVIFGWNPVILIQFGADGHNDMAMLSLLAWAMVALVSGRRWVALTLGGSAVSVKIVAGLAAAVVSIGLLRRRNPGAVLAGAATVLLVTAALYAPLWAGRATFAALLSEGRYFTDTPASLLVSALTPAWGADAAALLIGLVLRAGLVGALLYLSARAPRTPEGTIQTLAVVYTLAVTVLCAWYQPWYIAWPLLFWAMRADRAAAMPIVAVLTLGALLVPVANNFLPTMLGVTAENPGIDALAAGAWALPLAIALGARRIPWRRSVRVHRDTVRPALT